MTAAVPATSRPLTTTLRGPDSGTRVAPAADDAGRRPRRHGGDAGTCGLGAGSVRGDATGAVGRRPSGARSAGCSTIAIPAGAGGGGRRVACDARCATPKRSARTTATFLESPGNAREPPRGVSGDPTRRSRHLEAEINPKHSERPRHPPAEGARRSDAVSRETSLTRPGRRPART